MKTGSAVLELDEEVDSIGVEDVLALELDVETGSREVVMALEVDMLTPAGERALPLNWVSTTNEESATTITRIATVKLLFATDHT